MSNLEQNGSNIDSHEIFQEGSNNMENLSKNMGEDQKTAPVDLLTEFLSSVMIKDYEKALNYCTKILTFEPDNATALEFYPLIMKKLELIENEELEDSLSDLSDSFSNSTSSISVNSTYNNEIENKNIPDFDITTLSYSSVEREGGNVISNDLAAKEVHVTPTDIIIRKVENQEKKITPFLSQEHIPTKSCEQDPDIQEKRSEINNQAVEKNPQLSSILIHATPTITLKKESCLRLERTKTYTENFPTQKQNIMALHEFHSSLKNAQNSMAPTKKNFKKKISVSNPASGSVPSTEPKLKKSSRPVKAAWT